MTTAEQILASMSEVDKILVIDNDLRTINIPASVKNLGVQSDDDVLTVYFQMPSTYCGIDLSEFNIRINYLNAASEGDYHDVDDAEVQPDGTILFSWTIGRHAASVVGNVEFNVCMKKTDSSGNVIKEFNTTTASLPILKGLEISEQVISEYTDILEQWRAKLFGVGDTEEAKILAAGDAEEARILATAQQELQTISTKSATVLSDIELKGSETLATIPDTYTEVYNMAEEALRTKADAIVLEAEGTVISVNDSSDDHLRNLKLYGRTTQAKTTGAQLAYIPDVESFENNGITWSSNGGVVTAEGSAPIHSYTPSHIHADLKGLAGTFYLSGNGKYIKVALQYTRDGVTNYVNAPQEFTLDGTETRVELYCQITTYNVNINDIAYPMVNVGNTALPWEPYTGGKAAPNPEYPQELVSIENPSVDIYGKNLIKCDTQNVSFEDPYYYHTIRTNFAPVIGETYTLSMNVNTSVVPYAINVGCGNTTFNSDMNPKINAGYSENGRISITFTWLPTEEQIANEYTKLFIRLPRYAYPTAFTATVSDIMLELGSTATEYEPYVEPQTITLNHTLHGIPVSSGGNYTDENGQQWICDEIDFDRGVYIQRTKSTVLDGSSDEIWSYNTNIGVQKSGFFTVTASGITQTSIGAIMCENYTHPAKLPIDNCEFWGTDSYFGISQVAIRNDDFSDVTSWRANLAEHPISMLYALKTPIETPLTSEEILAYKALKTNRTNTTVLNDQNARMAIAYSADTLKFLRDNQPKPTDEQVEAAVNEYADEHGVQVPTDEHINELINAALGVIENGSY